MDAPLHIVRFVYNGRTETINAIEGVSVVPHEGESIVWPDGRVFAVRAVVHDYAKHELAVMMVLAG